MIIAAPCDMFLIRADTFRGQVGGGWPPVEVFQGWVPGRGFEPMTAVQFTDVWRAITVFHHSIEI
jgi:hypothetical protein